MNDEMSADVGSVKIDTKKILTDCGISAEYIEISQLIASIPEDLFEKVKGKIPLNDLVAIARGAEGNRARFEKAFRNFSDSDGDDDGGITDILDQFFGQTLRDLPPKKQISTSTKKTRGIASKTLNLRDAILTTFDTTDKPVTVRQMFYLLSVRGAVEKDDGGYRQAQRQLVEMRREKVIPYGWIADNTRWMRKPDTYSNVEDALRSTANLYRRAVWNDLDVYVEVWCEKDALAGVLHPITEKYDVPLMVCRGYSSESFAYEAAENIMAMEKQAYIYYLGDFDPSGWQMAVNLEEKLKNFGANITFKRLAITPEMTVDWWKLPTRPTKVTDTRCKDFFDRFGTDTPSIELDALPPNVLREIVRQHIEKHIPTQHLEILKTAEESERDIFGKLMKVAARETKKIAAGGPRR